MMTRTSATAFAPATVGNAAVGFDILGFSLGTVGDRITVTRTPKVGEISISSISDHSLPVDPAKNTATAGLLQFCSDLKLNFGFQLEIQKGIPIGSGMGGSAASAVGAIVAANALIEDPLPRENLMKYALIGESIASGSMHADNVAPCLYGGLTLALVTPSKASPTIIQIPVPNEILCVLVHPAMRLDTRQSRAVLKSEISLKTYVEQSALLAGFMASCYTGDLTLLGQSLSDILIEPQRAHLIPGFNAVKKAALEAGALGCSISGAGPSIFAWTNSRPIAERLRTVMVNEFMKANHPSVEAWISPISQKGAYLL